jgi:hypothetical protein
MREEEVLEAVEEEDASGVADLVLASQGLLSFDPSAGTIQVISCRDRKTVTRTIALTPKTQREVDLRLEAGLSIS